MTVIFDLDESLRLLARLYYLESEAECVRERLDLHWKRLTEADRGRVRAESVRLWGGAADTPLVVEGKP